MLNLSALSLATAILVTLSITLHSPAASALPGDVVGSEFPVNTYISGAQSLPSIAMDADGDFVVTWESYGQDGDSSGVYAQRYHADGSTAGNEFQVNTYRTNYQFLPSIAMDADGDFVVTWGSWDQDGSSSGIFAQRYGTDGSTVGSEFQVNTQTVDYQSYPSVAMDADGNFVIVWESRNSDYFGTSSGIYAQRYHADGSTAGGEFLVNTNTAFDQIRPRIAMSAEGDFVITWATVNIGSYGIYAQRYHANGSAVGNEFLVNTDTAGYPISPAIAMDVDGDFVITWANINLGSYGIYAQRYHADGSADGSEFQVNTHTTTQKNVPDIAMDADGDFVITWMSVGQDGDSYSIQARRYHADGSAAGDEFLVNTYTSDMQRFPSIAMDADGDFVITWQSEGQDGDLLGVYAQRYTGAGEMIDLSTVVQDDADPVMGGENFTYSINTTNNGTGIALDVKLSDTLPEGVKYVSDDSSTNDWNCELVVATLECNKAFMVAAEANTINLTVTAETAGIKTNTVIVSAAQTETNIADNTDAETTVIETIQADLVAPVIILMGTNPVNISQNAAYIDPGVKVNDNVDRGLIASVSGNVDTTKPGSYILSYDATDNSGNNAETVVRTVNVIAVRSNDSGDSNGDSGSDSGSDLAGDSGAGGGSLDVFLLIIALPLWLRFRMAKH